MMTCRLALADATNNVQCPPSALGEGVENKGVLFGDRLKRCAKTWAFIVGNRHPSRVRGCCAATGTFAQLCLIPPSD